ncbi:MAG: SMP-30/gluconolactonase/LRE family protein, partial [Caldimonas sp.]
WTDTLSQTVWAFDFRPDTGAMSGRRVFAQFAPRPERDGASAQKIYHGRPDGAAVDAEGCYWVAMYDGGCVLRLSPVGEILVQVRIPARCPTMPCFGGADMKTVYVTSARARRPAAELMDLPCSGCVFSFRVDVPGLPTQCAAPMPR